MTYVIPPMRKENGKPNYGFIAMVFVVPIFAIAAIIIGVSVTSLSQSPQAIYTREYTVPGKCLHGTPYDPAKGAFTTQLHDPKYPYPIFAVMPKDANYESPSVLFFSVFKRDGTSGTNLYADDQITTTFMYEKCGVDLR